MKKIIAILGLFLALSAKAVVLVWDPNPATDEVSKYTLFMYKDGAMDWVKWDTAADVTTFDTGALGVGRYWFYVTASNVIGESDRSNTILYTVEPTPIFSVPTPPKNLKTQ